MMSCTRAGVKLQQLCVENVLGIPNVLRRSISLLREKIDKEIRHRSMKSLIISVTWTSSTICPAVVKLTPLSSLFLHLLRWLVKIVWLHPKTVPPTGGGKGNRGSLSQTPPHTIYSSMGPTFGICPRPPQSSRRPCPKMLNKGSM